MKLSFSAFLVLLISIFLINTNNALANIEAHDVPIVQQKENFSKKIKSFENKVLDRLMTKRVERGLKKIKQFFKTNIGERQLLRVILIVILALLLLGLVQSLLTSLPLIRNIITILILILIIVYLVKQIL